MRELRQRFFLRLATFLTLTACFALLGFGALGAMNLTRVLTLWGEEVQISAYLKTDLLPSDLDRLQAAILADSRVSRVELITQEEALEDFRVQMASYAPDLAADRDLFSLIPPSLQITLKDDHASVASVEQVAARVRIQNGIEEVRFGQQWIETYASVLSLLRRSLLGLMAVIGVAGVLVIGNAVRASVEARRHEVEVYELIGATPWMIRKPFLVEGAVFGGFAAFTALCFCFGSYLLMKSFFQSELQFLQLSQSFGFFPLCGSAAFLATGTLLGLGASYLCIRRLNSGFAASGLKV